MTMNNKDFSVISKGYNFVNIGKRDFKVSMAGATCWSVHAASN